MSATLELLERYKKTLNVYADNAAASVLGVKTQTVSNWRTRGSQAEPKLIEKMCIALGEEAAPWLLRAQMEQAPDASNKLVWRRLMRHLGYKLAGVSAIVCLPSTWLASPVCACGAKAFVGVQDSAELLLDRLAWLLTI